MSVREPWRDVADLSYALRVLMWLHAELAWKFNEHRHDLTNWHTTDWGPIMPHWK